MTCDIGVTCGTARWMRSCGILLGLFCTIAATAAGLPAALNKKPLDLDYAPLRFKPPKPDRFVLDNGMIVYLLEDHELPLVSVQMTIRVGSIHEPADKAGLASITGAVMRTGGTKSMTGDEIDEELEFLSASVETSIALEQGTAGVNVLKKDLARGLEILADVLRNPVFDEDKLEVQKRQTIGGILRRNDDPEQIANREFRNLVFGKDSPWARQPEIPGVQNITREDCLAFHQRFFAPNNIIVAVSGDITKADIVREFKRVFKGWEKRRIDFPEVEALPKETPKSVNLISKDIDQTNVSFGNIGARRHEADEIVLNVLNFIFGAGGFNSRLMEEVRSNRGLAYSVYGYVGLGTDRGLTRVGCQTKASSTVEALQVSLDIMRDMTEEPPSITEIQRAKDTLSNQFVFRFDTPAHIVGEYASMEFLGYPRDYHDTYLKRLDAVTPEDVHKTAVRYFNPDNMVFLAVGNPQKFGTPLSTFGEVKTIELVQPTLEQ